MSDDIPQWAKERAAELANAEPTKPDCFKWTPDNIGPGGLASAFARYIAEREEDPLLIEAREIVARSDHDPWPDSPWHMNQAALVCEGKSDNSLVVRAALNGLRRGIELGRASK